MSTGPCGSPTTRPGRVDDAEYAAVYAAAYAKGVADGRGQSLGPVLELIENMLMVTKDIGPVEMHTNTCWQRHVRCALKAVAKRAEGGQR